MSAHLLRRVAQVEVLNLRQVELLGSEHTARSGDSNPADKGFCRDLVVLHSVQADEGACAAQSCLAVDGDGTGAGSGKMCLTGGHELLDDGLGRGRAIREDHVFVVDALRQEGSSIVLGFIETHHFGDVQVLVTETFAGWLGRSPGIWHRRSQTDRRDGDG